MAISTEDYNEYVRFIEDAKVYVKDIYAKLSLFSDEDKITWLEEIDDYNTLISEYTKYKIIYERQRADENVSVEHIVVEGDTLQKISAKYTDTHENWQRIYDFNNLTDVKLEPGTTVQIPKDLFLV
jgi:nucleoid-associated protein YgaU